MMPRILNWTKLTARVLTGQWLAPFATNEAATVTATWIGNRLVKDDVWIKKHAGNCVEGHPL
jgi:hypothetical protein